MEDLAGLVLQKLLDCQERAAPYAMHVCVKGWSDAGWRRGFAWNNLYAVVVPTCMPLLSYDLYFRAEFGGTSPVMRIAADALPSLLVTWMDTRPVERVATRVVSLVAAEDSPLSSIPIQTFFLNNKSRGETEQAIRAVLRSLSSTSTAPAPARPARAAVAAKRPAAAILSAPSTPVLSLQECAAAVENLASRS